MSFTCDLEQVTSLLCTSSPHLSNRDNSTSLPPTTCMLSVLEIIYTRLIRQNTYIFLLKGEAVVHTSDCRQCLDLSPGAGTGSRPACKRCAQVEDLLQQVAELQEAVRRLRNIREGEKELDSWFQVQSAVDPQPDRQKLPHWHTRQGGGPIMQKNGSLQRQGSAGGKDFPQNMRCPCKTASPLCRLKRKDPSHQERRWS